MLQRLSLAEFEACAGEFDRCVERTALLGDEIDRFCSRSEWILPFHHAFLPERELYLYRGEGAHGDVFAAFAAHAHESVGCYLEALETMWCFACPLVGRGATALLEAAIAELSQRGALVPIVLSGIPASRDRDALLPEILRALDGRYELRAVDATRRFVASLEGGLDGWLGRRAGSLRRNLRAATRKARSEDVRFEFNAPSSEPEAQHIYRRILDIEARSWKGAEGTGVDRGGMLAFYTDMLPRLARRRGLRVIIATRDGCDIGYVHGAVTGDHFRGLQLSSDASLARLSLGNLLQVEILTHLCDEGIRTYDLGTRSEYKRRWAEGGTTTLTVLAKPS